MIILGIDPGPTRCGAVVYDSTERRVLASASALTVKEALAWASDEGVPVDRWLDCCIVEQVMSQGQSGNDLLRTAEVSGRLYQAAIEHIGLFGIDPVFLPRREVCSILAVSGAGKDAQVREVMIEQHGGSKAAAIGTKKAPGPLYGVSGHAWQALGLVRAWLIREALEAARAQAGGAR